MAVQKLSCCSVLGVVVAGSLLIPVVPLVGPSSAMAQAVSFQTSPRSGTQRGIDERDVDSLVKCLDLSADQQALVDALYEGHRSAYGDASRAHRESLQSMYADQKEKRDWRAIAGKTREVQKQWKQTSEALERDFFDSVKSIATADQLANWPRFERDRRRRTLLGAHAALAGEGVDLIDLSESIELSPETLAQLGPVSNVYAEELDLALADRSRALTALDEASHPAVDGDFGSIDFEAVQERQQRLHEKRRGLRDVNERYAALFSSQLTALDAQRFTQLYKERCFPRVYRPTAANRYIDVVREVESLNDEQRRALESIEGDFHHQLAPINDQLASLIREEQEESGGQGMFFGGGDLDLDLDMLPPPPVPQGGETGDGEPTVGVFVVATRAEPTGEAEIRTGGRIIEAAPTPSIIAFPSGEREDDSPRGKLNKSKRELVSRTIDAVAGLLTPEQLAAAPKPDELQRLSPEARMQRAVERALENAVITVGGDGEQEISITVEPSSGDQP